MNTNTTTEFPSDTDYANWEEGDIDQDWEDNRDPYYGYWEDDYEDWEMVWERRMYARQPDWD